MEKLDFGMAMVMARFAGRETKKPSEGSEREGSPRPLIPVSWRKKLHRERILLPSDKELKGWRIIEGLLGSKMR